MPHAIWIASGVPRSSSPTRIAEAFIAGFHRCPPPARLDRMLETAAERWVAAIEDQRKARKLSFDDAMDALIHESDTGGAGGDA